MVAQSLKDLYCRPKDIDLIPRTHTRPGVVMAACNPVEEETGGSLKLAGQPSQPYWQGPVSKVIMQGLS